MTIPHTITAEFESREFANDLGWMERVPLGYGWSSCTCGWYCGTPSRPKPSVEVHQATNEHVETVKSSPVGGIVGFLTARYDEVEATAQAAQHCTTDCAEWVPNEAGGGVTVATLGTVAEGYMDYMDYEVARHIALHDPAHVLADIAAKRAILAEHVCQCPDDCGDCGACSGNHHADPTPFPCTTVRLLASVFSGHPDYDQEWAPHE